MSYVITLTVFSAFVVLYLGERIQWNHLAAFLCIIAAVAFTFVPTAGTAVQSPQLMRAEQPSEPK
jgi:drug/metabolite transporter (DMT)-like permease